MTTESNIDIKREKASQLSLGSSSDEILETVIQKFVNFNPSKDAKIFDIGCGQGHLLKRLKALGFNNLSGCDYSDFGSNTDYHFFQHDCNIAFPNEYKDFDYILCSEVIEHIENPWDFIRNIKSLCHQNTKVVFSTPNTESFLSIITFIFKGYFSAFGPKNYPAHITPLSAYELTNVFTQAGFKDVETYYVKNGRIPGTAMKWSSLLPFLGGKRFSDNFVQTARLR